jgi:hypothetical protein
VLAMVVKAVRDTPLRNERRSMTSGSPMFRQKRKPEV